MRVTQNMVYNNLKQRISDTNFEMNRNNDQVASGKRFKMPSEDSFSAQRVLGYKTEKGNLEQYGKNVDNGLMFMSTAESSLGDYVDLLSEMKTIAVQGANAALPDARVDLARKVDNLLGHVYALANTKFAGDYIFSGFQTKTAAFDSADLTYTYQGDTNNIQREVGEGVKETINLAGSQVFGSGATSVFAVIADLSTALKNNDVTNIQASITKIDDVFEQALAARATIGEKMASFNAWKDRLDAKQINTQDIISTTEDADMAEAILNLSRAQNAYEATLASSARIMQLSILDFLR